MPETSLLYDWEKDRDPEYYRRKADQEWEMAGLARQDNDQEDAARHTERAREFQRLCHQ